MGSAFLYKYPLQRACILIIDEMLIDGLSKLDIVSERLNYTVLYYLGVRNTKASILTKTLEVKIYINKIVKIEVFCF